MPASRPDLHQVCHANGLSHRPSPRDHYDHFIPVYAVDDDELAGALERANQEANLELVPPIFLLESHPRVYSVPTIDKLWHLCSNTPGVR